jgi:hypothetical protein
MNIGESQTHRVKRSRMALNPATFSKKTSEVENRHVFQGFEEDKSQ